MYARKLQAELVIGDERRPAPLDWLDSFCMRNFTGSAEFDDTLPTADGRLEAGLAVDPARLAQAMSEWFTKRGKGNGQAVTIELRELRHLEVTAASKSGDTIQPERSSYAI